MPYRPKRDGIDEGRERRVVSVGPNFLRNTFAVRLQLSDGAWPHEICPPAMTGRDGAADLRLVHCLRRGEAAKVVQIVNSQSDDGQRTKAAPYPNGEGAGFERVHRALNKFCATRHFVIDRLCSRRSLATWRRSFR